MYLPCTLKIKIETQIWNIGVSKTSDHNKIRIKMPNPSQELPVSSKPPNQDLKDIDVLCTFKIKRDSHGCIKDQRPYPNQNQDAKPQSGTSSILQSPKSGLKGHGCSLHLENQDSKLKLNILMFQILALLPDFICEKYIQIL